MQKRYCCEMMMEGKCAGCTGLAEPDWIGKYDCKEYQRLLEEKRKIVVNWNEKQSEFQK